MHTNTNIHFYFYTLNPCCSSVAILTNSLGFSLLTFCRIIRYESPLSFAFPSITSICKITYEYTINSMSTLVVNWPPTIIKQRYIHRGLLHPVLGDVKWPQPSLPDGQPKFFLEASLQNYQRAIHKKSQILVAPSSHFETLWGCSRTHHDRNNTSYLEDIKCENLNRNR